MPTFFPSLNEDHRKKTKNQRMFWTATAPLTGSHINVSPKGYTSFTILGPNQCAYVDLTGSGAETCSHLMENGRITILFHSFGPDPWIMRLFCKGSVIEKGAKGYDELLSRMEEDALKHSGLRAIVVLDVWKVQTSCGYGVPIVQGEWKERDVLDRFNSRQEAKGTIEKYRAEWNRKTLDGVPGLRSARVMAGERSLLWGDFCAWVRRVAGEKDALIVGVLIGVLVTLFLGRSRGAASGWDVGAGRIKGVVGDW